MSLHATPARADFLPVPLTDLIAGADAVVDATVTARLPQSSAEELLVTLSVSEVLAGSAPATVSVLIDLTDPTDYEFADDEHVIAFLEEVVGPASHATVGGHAGVIHLGPTTGTASLGLVTAAVGAGSAFTSSDAAPFLVGSSPAGATLVASTLATLEDSLSASDHPWLLAAACEDGADALPAVNLWAIERLGTENPAGARECLEAKVAAVNAAIRAKSFGADPAAISAVGSLALVGNEDSAKALFDFLKFGFKTASEDGKCRTPSPMLLAGLSAFQHYNLPKAAGTIAKAAKKIPDLMVSSTAVNALAAIGDARAQKKLEQIERKHPDPLIRQQATEALARIRG